MATNLPAVPKGHCLSGNWPDFRRDPSAYPFFCASNPADVVPYRHGPRSMIHVFHPDITEDVLVTKHLDFAKGAVSGLLEPLLGTGLLLSEGECWLRQRRLVQPGFHRQRVAAYGDIMRAYTEERLAQWKDGDTLDIHAEMMALTQAIVARTLFGAS